MKERRTSSILQRLPLILAVTAASYGLPLQAQTVRVGSQGMTASSVARAGGQSVAAVTDARIRIGSAQR